MFCHNILLIVLLLFIDNSYQNKPQSNDAFIVKLPQWLIGYANERLIFSMHQKVLTSKMLGQHDGE